VPSQQPVTAYALSPTNLRAPEQRREALGEHGSRHARLARQRLDAPGLSRRAVQGGERARDALVLQRREEALQLRRPLHVMAQDHHEHDLGEAVQQPLPAGGARFVLHQHQARECVQFSRGVPVFAAHHDHALQALHHRASPGPRRSPRGRRAPS
jgi:hypothetical protein